jgi:replicative DNA helicase
VQLVDLIEVATYEPDPFWAISQKIAKLAETDMSPEEKAARTTAMLRSLAVNEEAPSTGRLVTWPDFISEVTSDAYDWVIEGMLEKQERLMVVAAEGVGKTTLARQVAILSGAGIHPFNYTEIPPVRTLFVDLENPEKIIRRQSRRILDSIQANYPKRKISAALYTKPDGMNILTDRDKALLEEQIKRTEPELLVIGPIYKSFIDPGGKTSTALVTEVVMYFDYLRATYNIALWMEHHAPLGNALTGRDLRPSDSAVWMRWPEFGFAISPDPTSHVREYDFKQWRGPRDVRQWPAKLIRGTMFPFEVTEWAAT